MLYEVITWNGLALLKKFLPGVIKYTSQTGYEVVVADNGSTDHSLQYIKSTFPTVKTIDLGLNHGFAEGYNRALAQLDAEYFVLLNSDVDVTEQWLEPMVNLMDNNPDVAACGPKILHQQRPEFFEYAGAAGGFIDRYGYPFCRGRIFDFIEKDNGQYDNQIDCLWVSGCCLMVRATDYKLHGGLDGQFFAHMEEIDLCWRFNNNNKRVVFTPDSVVYHVGGASLDASHPKKTYLNFRNSLLCIYKNLTPNIFWISYVVRIPRITSYNVCYTKLLRVERPRTDFLPRR